jgi:hypothetical protein
VALDSPNVLRCSRKNQTLPRRRWQNYLNNDIKQGGWSEEEDRVLLEGHAVHGNKWTEIARMVTGRTGGAVQVESS